MPDVEEVHPSLAHQQVTVSLHIQHLVVVVVNSSLIELLFNPVKKRREMMKERERWRLERRKKGRGREQEREREEGDGERGGEGVRERERERER